MNLQIIRKPFPIRNRLCCFRSDGKFIGAQAHPAVMDHAVPAAVHAAPAKRLPGLERCREIIIAHWKRDRRSVAFNAGYGTQRVGWCERHGHDSKHYTRPNPARNQTLPAGFPEDAWVPARLESDFPSVHLSTTEQTNRRGKS